MSNNVLKLAVVSVFLGLGTIVSSQRAAVAGLVVVVTSGDPSPDGNGTFGALRAPVLNNENQLAFSALLNDTMMGADDREGIFRGGAGGLTTVAREGQMAPDGDGTFESFPQTPQHLALNDFGDATFVGRLRDTNCCAFGLGLFTHDTDGLEQIAREGDPVPGGNGVFRGFAPMTNNFTGRVTFQAAIDLNDGGTPFDEAGIFTGGPNDVTPIVRRGDAAPDGNGTFVNFTLGGFEGFDRTAFTATLTGTNSGSADDEGVFFGDGTDLVTIAREDQVAPDGDGVFDSFPTVPALNTDLDGEIAFSARLRDTGNDRGLFFYNGTSLTQLARKGDPAPDGNGTFSIFDAGPNLNSGGQVAFHARLMGTNGDFDDDTGVFRADGVNPILQIAREGDPAPGGGTFSDFLTIGYPLNVGGDVAFRAQLLDEGGFSTGIFFFSRADLTLVPVAREGDALLGSTITSLAFSTGASRGGEEASGLNNVSRVAFQFQLADGRAGIAAWFGNALSGDYNGDGIVDAADYTVWRDNLGRVFTLPGENPLAETPSTVDMEDYLFWRSQFGKTSPDDGSAHGAAVPEPTSLALLAIALAGLVRGWTTIRSRSAGGTA